MLSSFYIVVVVKKIKKLVYSGTKRCGVVARKAPLIRSLAKNGTTSTEYGVQQLIASSDDVARLSRC
jgi:hypothetical protein